MTRERRLGAFAILLLLIAIAGAALTSTASRSTRISTSTTRAPSSTRAPASTRASTGRSRASLHSDSTSAGPAAISTRASAQPVEARQLAPAGGRRLSGSTVLVTGAHGFIGSHLVERLAELGADVHAVSRRGPAKPGLAPASATSWQVDLADAAATDELVRTVRPDVVFHLAGEASGSREVAAVPRTFAGNLASTVNLLTAATEAGRPRIVLAGSIEEPHAGDAQPRALSPYTVSKWASAAYAHAFHDLWSLPTVVLRIAMVYGPGPQNESKLVPYVVKSLLAGQVPELSSGSRLIDWVYVDDVVNAFLAAACAPSVEGRSLDIGSGAPVDIRQTVTTLQQIIGTEVPARFGGLADRKFDGACIADLSESVPLLGWRPRVGLVDGLTRTVDWFRGGAIRDVTLPRTQGINK
ncbi:NAD-dependent epimerase/dehydratase family protein [Kribbella sp. NPDC004536]|uniref:NAD-dependent epimerase/dehydratase family protein n=1 Tax=Kribbella sp. NPDC004536 TaxID=3364106 RepID=UPI0036CC67F4